MIESWLNFCFCIIISLKGLSVYGIVCCLPSGNQYFFLEGYYPAFTSVWVLSFLGKHNASTNIWVSRMQFNVSTEVVGVLALPDGQPEEKLATFSLL